MPTFENEESDTMKDAEAIGHIMATEGLASPGATVHSARLPRGAVVHGVAVEPEQAERAWRFWRGRAEGLVPFLTTRVTSEEQLRSLAAAAAGEPVPEMTAEAADRAVADIVGRVGARSVAEAYPEDLAEEEELRDAARLADLLDEPSGTPLPGDPLAFRERWGSRPLWLLLVETTGSHRLPLLLPGFLRNGATAYPDLTPLTPGDHAAFLRHWQDRYGANVFFMNGAEIQLQVEHPPLDGRTIAELALEHNAYCDDLADVVDTANGQARSTVWSFWWD
ncbi:DUF4253 domain-containing protein [Streptomyces sp. NPDC096012]|uniref:DUF4253 domain-containing protein n=1 Tax=Streptomyces sp. NPDC096012 TaxID=3155684 RepID=UPI00336A18A7